MPVLTRVREACPPARRPAKPADIDRLKSIEAIPRREFVTRDP
jgi:hypothetical protein